MTLRQIKAADIAGWDSLEDIAASFEKRGLEEQPDLGDENELVLQLTDTEFITIVDAQAGETATDHKPDNRTRRTNLVATNDFENFTFLTRVRSWEGQQHGRIKHQKLEFSKDQFASDEGKKNTVLKKLNAIEYGSADAIRDTLYDTQEVVKEFYEQFEELRTDLVQEVSGIPDDRGDAKGRYVQVILDRMIFLYFIQEKRLLDREPKYLREHHDDKADAGEDVYEEFYHPLFFDYLAEDNQSREFGNLPYLNGGLFSKNPIEEEFPDAKLGGSTERTNELFDDILDFLSDWNWNVDERLDIVDPKNLSPAILGHIFEQTVNQKEMGAYYTPEEITGFMSRRTIHPYLLDQLNETVDAEYDSIDEVFALAEPEADTGEQAAAADGGRLTAQAATEGVETSHVETLYHDVLTDASVLDPAVGSGAFLLAAQDVLIDVYLQCLEFFEQVDTEGRGFELAGKTRDVLEEVGNGPSATSLYAKREIILNNLYGVDIDDGAVEICKLRLWLSMVADIEDEPDEVAPLPNIDFNIRQGNSLVGQVDAELEINSEGDSELDAWELKQRFREVQKAIREHKQAESGEKAQDWRKKAEERIEKNRDKFDEKLRGEFQDAGLDIGLEELREWDPFHWPLEFAGVFDEGGFDVIIGNPPWDMLYANRDDFFIRYDEQFRKYPSKTKDEVMGHLLSDPEVAWEWEEYKESIESRTDYFTKGDTYQLQSPVVGGRTMPTKNELSALFLERVYNLSDDGMEVSLLLPGTIFGGVMGKDLREYLLDNTDVEYLIGFENKGIFDQIHQQYRFAILDFTYGSETTDLRGIFNQNTTDILENINQRAVSIPREVLRNYSPEGRIFPSITSQQEVSVLEKVVDHPSLDADTNDAWSVNMLTKEFVESTDKDRLLTDPENADYPVYGGKNFHQFEHDNSFTEGLAEPKYWSRGMYDPQNSAQYRVREKNFNRGHLKRALYDSFGGPKTSKSQKQFVNDLLDEHRDEDLKEEDMLLDCTEYRIAIRDVSRSRDERTIISTVLPKDIVCLHTINTLKPYSIEPEEEHLSESPIRSSYVRRFTNKELFAATGLLNSIAFDFLMRTKVETHIIKREFLESQMPRLTDGDDWFHYISERAARLNCYGEEFAEMRDRLGGIDAVTDDAERRTVQAEIDAAAFHAYGLERDDVAFVLDDFHRVSNPRIMTEDYFDAVLEKYDELAEEGPYE